MTPVSARQKDVDDALEALGISERSIEIELTTEVETADCISHIRLNPNLSEDEFWQTFGHELLHDKGIPHNECTRKMGYSSKSLEKDVISAIFDQMILAKVKELRVKRAEEQISRGQT